MSLRPFLLLALFAPFTSSVLAADDIDSIGATSQAEFRQLAEDLGAAVSYKAVIPVASLGIAGFDIGASVTATRVEHRGAWNTASSGNGASTLYAPKVHIHKGLPAGFDVGAFYTSIVDTNIDVWGGEIRYAIVEGGVAVPAIAVRGTYSEISGVEQLNLNTKGIELGISKGFTVITPYAGIGRIWTEAEPVGVSNVGREKFSDTKLFAGATFKLLLGTFTAEADQVGDVTSYSVKLGVHF